MNILHVMDSGDPVLAAVFVLLIAMSFVSWCVIFRKATQLYIEKHYLNAFLSNYKTKLIPPEATESKGGNAVALLLKELSAIRPEVENVQACDRKEALETLLIQTLDNVKLRMDKGLVWLASIGSSAPFIGLFGTVWGIYGALMDISTQRDASLNVVAGPMGEALVATAIGLFAAIPAVLAYNAFSRANKTFMQSVRHLAERLELGLIMQRDSK